MNTTRIRQATNEIDECERALKWLRENGRHLTPRDKDSFSISVRLHYASACPGAAEATKVLDAFARHSIEDIVAAAISNCINTIELEREVIRREANSDA